MKKTLFVLIFMGSFLAVLLTGCHDRKTASSPQLKIYDIQACNVYMDFDHSPLRKEQHKFVISFYPTTGAETPDLIESITAYGPDGYTVELKNEPFKKTTLNGWVLNPVLKSYYYSAYRPVGFMKEGTYTLEVKCKDGSVLRQSRVQNNASTEAAVAFYKANKAKLLEAYKPSKVHPMSPDAKRKGLVLSRKTMKDLGGPDAYYLTYLYQASSGAEASAHNVIWWDNVFVQRAAGDVQAGLNRREVAVNKDLAPKTTYTYFVETSDANKQSETNYCIFQPHKVFTTP